MSDLPQSLFANPVWHALQTKHRHLAVASGDACRYPADVAPFAAVASPTENALRNLQPLLAPGESVWMIGDQYPQTPGLVFNEAMEVLQMLLPAEVAPPPPPSAIEIISLSASHAPEMVALTNLAFPGFFRPRTYEMGAYYGVRCAGELIAMGGERLMLQGHSEISGVCTHPAHRGKSLAASLIWHLARNHRHDELVSWLHVTGTNRNAIDLYLRLGFKTIRTVTLHRVSLAE